MLVGDSALVTYNETWKTYKIITKRGTKIPSDAYEYRKSIVWFRRLTAAFGYVSST